MKFLDKGYCCVYCDTDFPEGISGHTLKDGSFVVGVCKNCEDIYLKDPDHGWDRGKKYFYDRDCFRYTENKNKEVQDILPLCRNLAEVHIGDSDELGAIARKILKVLGN